MPVKKSSAATTAILGMACRFPGGANYRSFWRALAAGENHVTPVPPERWSSDKFYSSNVGAPSRGVSRWGGFLSHVDEFDHRFFGISPREARNMDPQQRLLLQEAWRCIEDSGVALRELQEARPAVYVSAMTVDYMEEGRIENADTDAYVCTGNFRCLLAHRISHQFGLRGLSLAIDTACSSSLVALHEARLALESGACDYAIVAGVSLNLHPWKYVSLSKARMLSPDGQCKTFDAEANGYVPGEGVAALLLQRWTGALGGRHRVHGLLRGSAVNHGGRAVSLTAPLVEAQRSVIVDAWNAAGLSPESCTYVEAHGTGTSLGDPIEMEALTQAFREFTPRRQYCRIGSVKTNIGHLEPAAGMAGVIKVLLMMKAAQVPPTLNLRSVNPLIEFERTPFVVASGLSPWDAPADGPRRAGVSSFGFGGVNAHVVLESHDLPPCSPGGTPKGGTAARGELFVLSARSAESLGAMLATWSAFAHSDEFLGSPLADVCRTLQSCREQHSHRFAVLGRGSVAAASILAAAPAPPPPAIHPARGAMRCSNGRQRECSLGGSGAEPVPSIFDDGWTECRAWARELGVEIGPAMGDPAARRPEEVQRCREFALRYAQGRQALATVPAIELISGEGPGFWAALALAGMAKGAQVMRRMAYPEDESAIDLARPSLPFFDPFSLRVIEPVVLGKGYLEKLAAAFADECGGSSGLVERARQLFQNQLTFRRNLEAWNAALASRDLEVVRLLAEHGPDRPRNALLELAIWDSLRKLGRKWQLTATLTLPHPATGELLDLLEDGFVDTADLVGIILDPSQTLPIAIGRAADRVRRIDLGKPYRVLQGLGGLLPELGDVARWLKDAPRSSLPTRLAQETLGWILGAAPADADPSFRNTVLGDRESYLAALKEAWDAGLEVEWRHLPTAAGPSPVALPAYEFVGSPHWTGEKARSAAPLAPRESFRVLDPNFDPVIRDHLIGQRRLLPAATMLEMALGLSHQAPGRFTIQDFEIRRPCVILGPTRVEAATMGSAGRFEIRANGQVLATGTAVRGSSGRAPVSDADAWQQGTPHDIGAIYDRFSERGYAYGPSLRTIREVRSTPASILFHIGAPEGPADPDATAVDARLDVLLQAALVAGWHFGVIPQMMLLPCGIGSLSLESEWVGSGYAVARREDMKRDRDGFSASLDVFSKDSRLLLTLDGVRFREARGPDSSPRKASGTKAADGASAPPNAAAGTQAAGWPDMEAARRAKLSPVNSLKLEADLGKWLSLILMVDCGQLDGKTDLREYGLDSVALTEYAETLEKHLGISVDPTRLFEHPTLRGLASHLAEEHREPLSRLYPRIDVADDPGTGELRAPAQAREARGTPPAPTPAAPAARPLSAGGPLPVAVVGMAGRFPGCEDLESFWMRIAACEDLVTEVPADRWNWADYFGDPHVEPNKTRSKWGGFLTGIDGFDRSE